MNAEAEKAPKNLRVEQEPYPHLRDEEGCVLARDYEDEGKTAFIVRAVNCHDEMLEALKGAMTLVDMLEWPEGMGDKVRDALKARRDAIRAAIAKATNTSEGTGR